MEALPEGHWSSETKVKPKYRGTSHEYGFFAVLGASLVLVALAPSQRGFDAALVYGGTLAWVLGMSALYHRPMWSLRARKLMRRLDHASIFVLVIGTYTPICKLALPPEQGEFLLRMATIGSVAGMVVAFSWAPRPRFVSVSLYMALGWMAVAYLDAIRAGLGPLGFALIVAGGLLYTIGGVVYGLRWPDPYPGVFGYHEVFHLFVVLGCCTHFAMVTLLVRATTG